MATSFLHALLQYTRLCWNCVLSFLFGNGGGSGSGSGGISLISLFQKPPKLLTFDNGLQVEMGKQIAEGGFSYVFEAYPVVDNRDRKKASYGNQRSSSTLTLSSTNTNEDNVGGGDHPSSRKYALKRINCSDHELVQSCRHEAGIHRSLPSNHPNLLELLGLKFDLLDENETSTSSRSSSSRNNNNNNNIHNEYNVCYMLFPYLPHSLRGEITARNILYDPYDNQNGGRRRPFATREIVPLFGGLLDALLAMHNANLSHRDVKLENVLLKYNNYGDHRHGNSSSKALSFTPVVMDFGSAGPLTAQLSSRSMVLTAVETAASHTTMPYRPPELFEGGLRHGPREILDYGKVDVWSLGCVLFGLMHGTSPFEMEYPRSNGGCSNNPNNNNDEQYGLVRIVECTHLKILGEVPFPPWMGSGLGNSPNAGAGGDGRNGKYPTSLYKFVRYMVHHDRNQRPNIHEVVKRYEELHAEIMGERWTSYDETRMLSSYEKRSGGGGAGDRDGDDDFDSLIASRDFV
eukprot:CAMPEP_0183731944 /NCGR_PEP_ID=MMETSP0737-20130205/36935_1 /TAXON_ID=385413 /ORGANISM="Thalassiosira miniscula, Strain CCMP1093" /LENGTH=516 /DNA_ID=CAMNT_0025964805 /DNA_START=255 /DNA_END=1805 /DNA_ORIENTATION=-